MRTLDRFYILPIIPPNMVTYTHFRDFLFEHARLTVSFVF